MRLVLLGSVSSTALLSHLVEQPHAMARVAEIDSKTGGRTFELSEMQSYVDFVAFDSSDTRQHPVTPIDSTSCMVFTHKAVKSGNWSDPTVWNTGTVPHDLADGTATVCTSGYDITYDMLSDIRIKDIHVNGAGTLRFATTQTRLWVDTLMSDGSLIIGDVDAPIPDSGLIVNGERVPQCEVVFWASEAPLDTTRLGISTMGPVRYHGAAKTSGLDCNNDIPVGATSAILNKLDAANWQIGDRILFTSTEKAGWANTDPQYTGATSFYGPQDNGHTGIDTNNQKYKLSQDEVRLITAIDVMTDTISWDTPLTYPHKVYSDTLPHGQVIILKPVVANLSRSIRMRTADASDTVWAGDLAVLQKRAHQMFMYNDDVQIRYAESKNMGRTSTDPSLYVDGLPRYATSDTSQPISDFNNVRGRYSWHFHGMGPYMFRKMAVLHGCTAWAPTTAPPLPGWAYTHHNSRAAFEYCVGYNGRGALMVSEAGNEIGQWIGNIMCWARGDGFEAMGWATRHENWENHNGHSGVAYENQARQVLMLDNLATSCRTGWMYLLQNNNVVRRVPDQHSLRIRDPITKGGGNTVYNDDHTYGAKQPQIPHFDGNRCMDVYVPLFVAHRAEFVDREDSTPWVVRNFHNVHSKTDFLLTNYSFQYNFYDCLWWGNDEIGSAGAEMGTVSWHFNFSNIHVRNKNNVFRDLAVKSNYNGFTIDITHKNISGVAYPSSTITVADADDTIANHPYRNFMDQWAKVNATTVRLRQWRSLDSATELPQPYPLAPLGKHLPEGHPPVVPGDTPYFVLDAGANTTIDIAAYESFYISGTIRDSVGDRRYPDHQSPESVLNNYYVKGGRTGRAFNGRDLIQRNGCFYDNGVLKSRAWFFDADRFTGVPLVFSIDMTIGGTLNALDLEMVNKNLVDPNATKPELLIAPETTRNDVIVRDTTIPVITTTGSITVTNGNPLYLQLKASKGIGRWVIGGVDAARFEIHDRHYLRFASNGVKDSAFPDDADANGIYQITLTFIDSFGNTSAPLTSTVTLTPFEDNFDGEANSSLTGRYGWTQIAGAAPMLLNGSGAVIRPSSSSYGEPVYRAFDLTSYDQAVDINFSGSSGQSSVFLRFYDTNNFIEIRYSDSPSGLRVLQRKGGVYSEIARYSQAGAVTLEVIGNIIRVRNLSDGTARVTVTGNSGSAPSGQYSATMTNPPPPGYGCGIWGRLASSGSWLSRVVYRALGSAEPLSFAHTPPVAYRGTPYSYKPRMLGSRLGGEKTFALTGTLPAGLTFDAASGTISGTPTTNGSTAGIALTATDTSGSIVQNITLEVTDAPAPVVTSTNSITSGYTNGGNRSYSVNIGTPASNRVIAVVLTTHHHSSSPTAAKINTLHIGGVQMIKAAERIGTNAPSNQRVQSSVWYLPVGGTEEVTTLVINAFESWGTAYVDVYSMYNVATTPTETYANEVAYPGVYNYTTASTAQAGVAVAGAWYSGGKFYGTTARGNITAEPQAISLTTDVGNATWVGLTETRDVTENSTTTNFTASTFTLAVWRNPPAQEIAPVNTAAPQMEGYPNVGRSISASNATWGVSPDAVETRYIRRDAVTGADSTVATTAPYTLLAADQFSTLRVEQRARKGTAWSNWAASAWSPPIWPQMGAGQTITGHGDSLMLGQGSLNTSTGSDITKSWFNRVFGDALGMTITNNGAAARLMARPSGNSVGQAMAIGTNVWSGSNPSRDYVVLAAGGNDALGKQSLPAMINDLRFSINIAKAKGYARDRIIIGGMYYLPDAALAPYALTRAQYETYQVECLKAATEYGLLYTDMYSLIPGAGDVNSDNIHPTDQGYLKMTQGIAALLPTTTIPNLRRVPNPRALPTGLAGSASGTTITSSCDAYSQATGYEAAVMRVSGTTTSDYVFGAISAFGTPSFTFTGLTAATPYRFAVRAVLAGGLYSPWEISPSITVP